MNELATPLCIGVLAKDSPMRAIFPSGTVPLVSDVLMTATIEGDPTSQEYRVLLLQMDACTDVQKEAIAQVMSHEGRGTLEEARAHLATCKTLPIREMHFKKSPHYD